MEPEKMESEKMESEKNKHLQLGELQPHHGWTLRWMNGKYQLRMWIKRILSMQFWRVPHVHRLHVDKISYLSDIEIRAIPLEEIPLVSCEGIWRWNSRQLEALTASQMQMLTADQLSSLICSPSITADQIERLIIALSEQRHVGKISVILQALQGDPLDANKIAVIADAILNELSPHKAKEVLVVFSRASTNRQFEKLVSLVPFEIIQKIVAHELKNPNQKELERLDLRVEERQLANSYQLIQLAQSLEDLEIQHQRLVNGELKILDFDQSPWQHVSRDKAKALQKLIRKGALSKKKMRRANELFVLMKIELSQEQAHLQSENCRVACMVDLWNETYLDDCHAQGIVLARIVYPQYEVLKEIVSVLCYKGEEPLPPDAQQVLLDTLLQGKDLARTIQPEVKKAKKLLLQLHRDKEFLQEGQQIFMDQIRHETRIGRFSLEFFRRLILIEQHPKAFHILHGDGFEELIVDYPQLSDAIKMIENVLALKKRIDELYAGLEVVLERLEVGVLSEQLEAMIKYVQKTP